MGMTSFEFSNCVHKNKAKSSSSVQFEKESDSNLYNKYEQITTSYLLSVLEYNIHKTSKVVEY